MRNKNFYLFAFYFLGFLSFINIKIHASRNNIENDNIKNLHLHEIDKSIHDSVKRIYLTEVFWENIKSPSNNAQIKWEKIEENSNKSKNKNYNADKRSYKLNSLNRSIIFGDEIVGPDIGWIVPIGFKWNKKYSIDLSTRGYNRRKEGESFFGWNGGDAVGQFYYQPINIDNYSMGINVGMRSVYSGSAPGGESAIGEGLSLGFRFDKNISDTSGFAFGAEQLLHFDGETDSGRDIYLTVSKGWWSNNTDGDFPLNIATFGFGTGKLAEGTIKGLCSDLLGGSGTEVMHKRRLCWAPVFSLARVYNPKFSTFFEYNSTWFLLGSSISPFEEIPLRGTFAVQISDHIHNYKVNDFDNLKWVFRLSLGF